jgi:hypothetical protein
MLLLYSVGVVLALLVQIMILCVRHGSMAPAAPNQSDPSLFRSQHSVAAAADHYDEAISQHETCFRSVIYLHSFQMRTWLVPEVHVTEQCQSEMGT